LKVRLLGVSFAGVFVLKLSNAEESSSTFCMRCGVLGSFIVRWWVTEQGGFLFKEIAVFIYGI